MQLHIRKRVSQAGIQKRNSAKIYFGYRSKATDIQAERVSDFTLLRSAEIAIENGYRYFVIVESEKYSKSGTYTTPTTSHTTGSAVVSGNYIHGSATTTSHGGKTYVSSKPRENNTILCFKDKPDIEGLVFEATFIIKSIKAKYGMN